MASEYCECYRCEGRGKITSYDASLPCVETSTCPVCHGNGKVEIEDDREEIDRHH